MKTFLACLITALVVGGTGSAFAVSQRESRANDHIFVGTANQFREYFKQDAPGGSHNYMYTITNQPIPAPGTCDIYTFSSESYAFPVCNPLVAGQGTK